MPRLDIGAYMRGVRIGRASNEYAANMLRAHLHRIGRTLFGPLSDFLARRLS